MSSPWPVTVWAVMCHGGAPGEDWIHGDCLWATRELAEGYMSTVKRDGDYFWYDVVSFSVLDEALGNDVVAGMFDRVDKHRF